MKHLVFFHANGYPAGCYRPFFDALAARGVRAHAANLATPPNIPAALRFGQMETLALHAVRSAVAVASAAGGTAFVHLLGHSMGGYLALHAARHWQSDWRAALGSVVLIDAPMVTGWRSALLSSSAALGLSRRLGPAPIAARRRDHWPDRAAAQAFFSSKAFVQAWDPASLEAFLDHGLVSVAAGAGSPSLTLAIGRQTESDIYATLPHRKALGDLRFLQRKGVTVAGVFGQHSRELQMAGADINRQLLSPHWRTLPTGHLVPMEQPLACAELVAQALGLG